MNKCTWKCKFKNVSAMLGSVLVIIKNQWWCCCFF